MNKQPLTTLAILLLATLACNAPAIDDGTTATEAVSAEPTTTPTETAQPTADNATDACPQPREGTQQVINEAGGYCLLVPADYESQPNLLTSPVDVFYYGQALYPDQIETPSFFVSVNTRGVPGAAETVSLEEWRAGEFSPFGPIEILGEVEVDGNPGYIALQPGLFATQGVTVKANDTLYSISSLYAQSEAEQPFADEIEAVWDLILETMTFFPPTEQTDLRAPDEVCPEAQTGLTLEIDYQNGLCFLHPASWEEDPDFQGRFIGGPVIGEYWPGSPDQVSIAVGNAGDPNNGDTLEEILETRKGVASTPAAYTYEFVQIGDQPGAVVDDQSGPVHARVGMVWYNEDLYTLLAQPIGSDGQAALEEAWQIITETVRFFEPWR